MEITVKRFVKDILAQLDYSLYRAGIRSCPVKVHTIEETIEELIHTDKSMVRFGDGEITMIRGRSLSFQQTEEEINRTQGEFVSLMKDLVTSDERINQTLNDLIKMIER